MFDHPETGGIVKHHLAAIGLVFALAGAVGTPSGAQLIDSPPWASNLSAAPESGTVDPQIVGVWKESGKNSYLEFKDNHRGFFGTKDTPYEILDDGKKLVINKISTYLRVGPKGKTIVGRWRDDANGEEFIFRSDGRYAGWDDGEVVGYFGTYSVANSKYSGFEYRFLFETKKGTIAFRLPRRFYEVSLPYEITDNGKKLTLGAAGSETVYTRQ